MNKLYTLKGMKNVCKWSFLVMLTFAVTYKAGAADAEA